MGTAKMPGLRKGSGEPLHPNSHRTPRPCPDNRFLSPRPQANVPGDPPAMSKILTGIATLTILLSAACGENRDGAVTLKVITPAGIATEAPADEITPISQPELLLSTEEAYQAGAILVSLTGPVSSGSVTALGRTLPLSKGAQSIYTVVPIDTDAPPGRQSMIVDFMTSNGSKGRIAQPFTVLETRWTQDSLTFTPEQISTLLDPVVTNTELAQLREIYSKVTPDKLWDGPWLLPLQAPLTARYGEARSINGGPFEGHHSGTDFGADEGTPLQATNNGVVVLARPLTVRGNAIVINHGGGLYSAYAHLKEVAVTEGQLVASGEVIGEVGNTGLSTGPHLHWEMSQSGVLLDALRFVDGSNGF